MARRSDRRWNGCAAAAADARSRSSLPAARPTSCATAWHYTLNRGSMLQFLLDHTYFCGACLLALRLRQPPRRGRCTGAMEPLVANNAAGARRTCCSRSACTCELPILICRPEGAAEASSLPSFHPHLAGPLAYRSERPAGASIHSLAGNTLLLRCAGLTGPIHVVAVFQNCTAQSAPSSAVPAREPAAPVPRACRQLDCLAMEWTAPLGATDDMLAK